MNTLDVLSTAFSWPVAKSGYQWRVKPVDLEGRPTQVGPVLLPALPEPRVRRYRPLRECPDLFQRFADLRPDQTMILGFANQYGMLTAGAIVSRSGPVVLGEPLRMWQREIRAMQDAVTTWRSSPRFDFQQVVNHHLAEQAVSVRLFRSDSKGTYGVGLAPRTLLGALWLQLAWAIGWKKEYRRCKVCPTVFEVSRDQAGRRSDAKFCGKASCRQKWYRQKAARRRRTTQRRPAR